MATRDIRDAAADPIDKIIVSDDLFLRRGDPNAWVLECADNGEEIVIEVDEMKDLKKALDFILEL